MNKSTLEIRKKALELYTNGNSVNKIAEKMGYNEATIRFWFKKLGIKIKNGGEYNKKYSEELINNIKKLYINGAYTTQIDKMLKLRRGASQYILSKQGIKLRHRGPKSKIEKEDFFDIIDSEEKAYFLGYIIADANISIINNQYCLKFHIAYIDKKIIDDFLSFIKSSNKTSKKTDKLGNESYYVSLTSVHMCKRLIMLGVIPCKTGKEKIPKEIPNHLIRHFLRGLFDGDGITDVKKLRSGFVGSPGIIDEILNFLNEDYKTYYAGKNKKVKYFLSGKKFSRKLYELLYSDAKIFLERKESRLRYIAFNDGTPYEVKVSRTV